jgi:ABC-type dipeptide/oligopeptide/nickel transport system ATPase subunit
VIYDGREIKSKESLKEFRKKTAMVFQDPYSSLNPRMTVSDIVAEPLDVHKLYQSKQERNDRVLELLSLVGLNSEHASRYAHEFSGGQRQRIAIARAMVLKPKFVVLDEPTSALDMSVQAQIVDLLRGLQEKHRLAYLFISHDLKVVRALSDEVIVMKNGKVVEHGSAVQIFEAPQHPYTQALLKAALELKERRKAEYKSMLAKWVAARSRWMVPHSDLLTSLRILGAYTHLRDSQTARAWKRLDKLYASDPSTFSRLFGKPRLTRQRKGFRACPRFHSLQRQSQTGCPNRRCDSGESRRGPAIPASGPAHRR